MDHTENVSEVSEVIKKLRLLVRFRPKIFVIGRERMKITKGPIRAVLLAAKTERLPDAMCSNRFYFEQS